MRTNRLLSLDIEGLRNIERARLDTDESPVWLFGSNGAGKSSVLEAIYLIARGRSYRGRKFGPLMNRDLSRTLIKGQFVFGSQESVEARYLQNKEGVRRELVPPDALDAVGDDSWIPIKLVTDNPQALIEGDPNLRRLFLDWNVLLWNRGYRGVRQTFHRVLLQRNAALKVRWSDARQWDGAFVEASESVHDLRSAFVTSLRDHFHRIKTGFHFLDEVDVLYDPGWNSDLSLAESLSRAQQQERARGFTLFGPHRADLCISRGGKRAALSRGQMKVVVCLLQLACEIMHRDAGMPRSIWMLDDIEAELDEENAAMLWSLFIGSGAQLFASGVSREPKAHVPRSSFAMFHVEHGALTRTN